MLLVDVCFAPRRREDRISLHNSSSFSFNVQGTGTAGGAGDQGHSAQLA